MIRFNDPIGNPDCPYCWRWMINLWFFSIRLHHWIGSDDQRYLHDHPYWFVTFILRGGYTDVTDSGSEHLGIGSIRLRPSKHKHTVLVDNGGCWSLVIAAPETRRWGFYVDGKRISSTGFFRKYGQPPCES